MIKCPCCSQPWHDIERFRLLDSVALSPRGAVPLSPREDEIVTYYLLKKPITVADLSERLGTSLDCARTQIRTTNEKLRRIGWHIARFEASYSNGAPEYGLCEIVRNPDGSFMQTHEMRGPAALKPQWHHA